MGSFNVSLGRKTSIGLFLAAGAAGFSGCSGTDPVDGSTTAGTGPVGTAGTATGTAGSGNGTAGSGNGTAGTGNGTAGNGTAGSGNGTAGAGTAGSGTGGSGTAGSGTAGTGGSAVVDPNLEKFSFFVTSMAGLLKLAKNDIGFGGDLRYGTADGLTGADKICTELAESSMPGSGAKQWHAFLSTSKVNAKDRIGAGPWYDRTGRLVSMNVAGLLKERPDADAAIKENLPHEGGIGNHQPVAGGPEDDNHHTLTGSKGDGTLFGPTATCKDWTSNSRDNTTTGEGVGRPKTGFCWSTGNRRHWIDGQEEGGCGAGVTGVGTVNGGSDPKNPIVGSGGGYGAFYCFAMVP